MYSATYCQRHDTVAQSALAATAVYNAMCASALYRADGGTGHFTKTGLRHGATGSQYTALWLGQCRAVFHQPSAAHRHYVPRDRPDSTGLGALKATYLWERRALESHSPGTAKGRVGLVTEGDLKSTV
jgi:hypothetical protein